MLIPLISLIICSPFSSSSSSAIKQELISFNDASFPQRLFPEENSHFALQCPLMSEKTSAQHIVWYRDGQPLERHSSQLSIPSIASSDAGLYRCYVSNAFGGAFSPAVNVSVNYFHGFGDEPDSFFDRRVVLNSPINLRPPSLKIGGYMSNLHWAWFKDGQKLNSDDRRYFLSYSGELVVLRADDLAMGIYRVEVHRNLTPVFRARDYRVVAEPSSLPIEPSFDIIYRPRDVKVVIMNTNKGNPPTMATFECVPNLRNALETEIRWLLNSEQLSDSTGHVRFELGGQRLRILDVAQLLVGLAAHSVAIQCKVRIRTVDGAHWMDQADARLDILEKPRLLRPSLAPVVVEKREGDPLQLECHAERAWPRANFSWYFNDQKLENTGAERLVISNLSVNHFGAYQCEATNTAGTDIVPIWVVRHEDANHSTRKTPTFSTDRPTPSEDSQSPIIIQGPQNQSLLIGSKAQLPCQIAPGNDGLMAFWFINNEQIPSAGGDPFHRVFVDANGTMWINQVGPDNTGEYRCTARTTVGGGVERARQTAWLSIIEKPAMVQNVRAELTNSTGQERILVHWTPGFDGNSPVVKWSVEMRTKPTGQLTVFWSDWELAIELFSPAKLVASSDCCETFVENVRPAATAEFRVIAHNKFGVGKPSLPSQNVKMPQRPPTAVPTKVHASARSSQSVMVQWQPPEHGETNEESDIRGYLVRYRLSGYSTADWNDRNVSDGLARNVLIEPLITWREYDVQVAAYNDRGLGVFSRPVTVTTLEGLPLQAPQNVHVKVINSTAILLAFDPPNQQMILGVNLGYRIELWEGPPALFNQPSHVERLVPAFSRIEHQIERLKKFARYNLTVLCFTAPGDGPRSDPVEFQTAEDLPGPVRSLEPLDVFSESALVQWEAPVEPNGIIQKYLLAWTENGSNKRRDVEISGHQHNYSIEGLLAQTKYTVELTAFTKIGAGLMVETRFESGVPPELPSPPTGLSVAEIMATKARIHFVPGSDGHAPIRKWLIEARIGHSSAFVPLAEFRPLHRGTNLLSLDTLRPNTAYQIRLPPFGHRKSFGQKRTSDTQISLAWTPLTGWEWSGEGPHDFVLEYGGISLATLSPNQTEVERAFEQLKMAQFVIPGGAKIHQYQLSGLRPFSLYQFRILSRNRVGQSRPGDVVNATTFEGVPSVAPALRAKLNAQGGIEVHWDQLELDQANGLIVAYKVRLRADDGELLEREVSSSEARTVVNFPSTTLRPYTKYAVTVSAGTVVGEGPVQERPIMLETPQDVTDSPSNVSFVYKSPTELRLGWTTPSHPNGQILHYGVLMWRNGDQRPAIPFTEVPANLNQFMATQLLPETVYNFALNAQTAVGWGAERVLRVRTGKQSAPLPIPPVPQRDTSTAQSSTALHLIWDSLDNTNSSNSNNNVDESNSPARAIELAWQRTNHQPQHEWITVDECIPVERHRHTVKRCS
ncbi:hypothetical protein GPALN_014929 [Globodera pallida]|nr:hypothetical protein GPALN_014929 [Globodera pallida]